MAVTGEDAVRSAVMDYVEGWFEGDAGRMERALHPELVKRCLCHRYVDLLHLIDMPDGWKIVNAAWRLR
jgi:hypothetical protein